MSSLYEGETSSNFEAFDVSAGAAVDMLRVSGDFFPPSDFFVMKATLLAILLRLLVRGVAMC